MMRVLIASRTAFLVELDDLHTTQGLVRALQNNLPDGVTELVPGACTVLVNFDARVTTATALIDAIKSRPPIAIQTHSQNLTEIPVHYDGDDLDEVASQLGISRQEVIGRHTGVDWFVAFTGFAPGYAYMTSTDELLSTVPRRSVPRTRVPSGAVAIAGGFSAVYPKASPGGWQLLGQTRTPMWDLSRDPPALLQPGQRVRFVDVGPLVGSSDGPATDLVPAARSQMTRGIEVMTVGVQALIQDLGRPHRASQGVAASGAVDSGSLRRANRLVGNPLDAACIELAHGGFSARSIGDNVVSVTGAQGPLTFVASSGEQWEISRNAPFAMCDGDRLLVGEPIAGVRYYIAVRGSFIGEGALGSLSFDTLAQIGPAPLRQGDRLEVARLQYATPVMHPDPDPPSLPARHEIVALDVILGPRTDWFDEQSLAVLCSQEWKVSPHSNRVGVRLEGDLPLGRSVTRELPSEGTVLGAIQVPASGQPVIFLADHPVTGGYPVIASIAPWHMDTAGQLAVGTSIRFRAVNTPTSVELFSGVSTPTPSVEA
jgi:KipI family sensor histidine kinase inhibitor